MTVSRAYRGMVLLSVAGGVVNLTSKLECGESADVSGTLRRTIFKYLEWKGTCTRARRRDQGWDSETLAQNNVSVLGSVLGLAGRFFVERMP